MKALLYPIDKSQPAVYFDAVPEESKSLQNTITTLPVESGRSISDHVDVLPDIFTFNGVITGDDAEQKTQILQRYRDEKLLLRYVGRQTATFVVIDGLDINTDVTIANGYYVSLSLQQVRRAVMEEEVLPGPDPTVSDATRIMRIIVGLEEGIPGVDYNISDVSAILRQVVGMRAETSQEKDAGYIQPSRRRGGRFIPVDKNRMPYRCQVNVDGWQFDFTFRYDRIADRFSADIDARTDRGRRMRGRTGAKLVYGVPLFIWGYMDSEGVSWQRQIAPKDVGGRETSVNFENFGETVFLFIEDEG